MEPIHWFNYAASLTLAVLHVKTVLLVKIMLRSYHVSNRAFGHDLILLGHNIC